MVKENKSKSMSMKGYNFKTWLLKNKESLKYIIMAVSGIAAGTTWGVAQGGLISAITKFALDGIDFWLTDVKI